MTLLPWKQVWKLQDFRRQTGSKANGVAPLIHVQLSVVKALRAVNADVQPAASGPMAGEKQADLNR